MTDLIAKAYIKKKKLQSQEQIRKAYGLVCGAAGIALNVVLFVLKLIAGLASGAVSVISDALNNLMDAASSVITLIGFKLAGKKPDKTHPFGHGRIEYVAGLAVSAMIILVGFSLARTGVEKLFDPNNVKLGAASVAILVLSLIIKGYMAFYNYRTGKKISSYTLKAAATDSLCDSAATLAVLVCLIVSNSFGIALDAYCTIAVSVFIMYSGVRSAKETLDPLLGKSPDKTLIESITKIVFSHENVLGIHDLIVHDYGPDRLMVSLHAEVDSSSDILMLHDDIDNIEREIARELNCHAVIHMDPIVTNDEEVNCIKKKVEELVAAVDPALSIHDFRMVKGPTHTNLIFDITLPFDIKLGETEAVERIDEAVKALDPSYYTVINVDREYY